MAIMSNVLVDTSVWISFFRGSEASVGDAFDTLLSENRVVLCGIVEMEIVQGLTPKDRKNFQHSFTALHYLNTTREDFVSAGAMWNDLRRSGKTVPSTDCLIAQLAIRHKLPLFTLDSHFDAISSVKRFEAAGK